MASVTNDGGKRFRIRFYDGNGKREQFRISGINQATAEQIGRHVDVLNAAKMAGEPLRDRQTAIWLQKISQTLHDKLAAVGLVEPRVFLKLGEYLTNYIERADVVAGTKMNFGTVKRNLVDFFGADKPLRAITTANATEFR